MNDGKQEVEAFPSDDDVDLDVDLGEAGFARGRRPEFEVRTSYGFESSP
jgi:hypothetical protein